MMRCVLALLLWSGAVPALAQSTGGAVPNPFGDALRSSTSHLTVESRISPRTAVPGTRLTVIVEVTPRRTMHVYAPGKHDYQVVALVLDPQPWLGLEPTRYPPSGKYYFEPLDETVEVYSERFRLTRAVTLGDSAEARKALAGRSSVTITGRLEYQACDDKVCYSPTKVPIEFVVTVGPKAGN